jgi:anti-sigma B factor antagonist
MGEAATAAPRQADAPGRETARRTRIDAGQPRRGTVDDAIAPLTVRVSQLPSGWVLRVAGELDAATAPQLVATFQELPVHGSEVVVDIAEVSFIDSSGLRSLLLIRQETDATDRVLLLRRPARQAQRLLQMSGLTELLAPDEPEPA